MFIIIKKSIIYMVCKNIMTFYLYIDCKIKMCKLMTYM